MYPVLKIASLDLPLYIVFNFIAVVALAVHNALLLNKKKKNLSLPSKLILKSASEKDSLRFPLLAKDTFFAVVETVIVTAVQYAPLDPLGKWFAAEMNLKCRDYFGGAYFFPFITIAFCLLVKIEPLKQLDLFAPGYAIALGFSKLGCFCFGCCAGMETEHGMYNELFQKEMFPVQLVEAAFGFLIFFILLKYKKKAKSGTMYPMYLILYSSTRFCSEFFRHEPNIIGSLKSYHIQCLVGIAVGLIELLLMLKFGEKITEFFEKNSETIFAVEIYKTVAEYFKGDSKKLSKKSKKSGKNKKNNSKSSKKKKAKKH